MLSMNWLKNSEILLEEDLRVRSGSVPDFSQELIDTNKNFENHDTVVKNY